MEGLYSTVKEGEDPRGGLVALFFGKVHADDTEEGFWVENQRTAYYSDFVSEEEANELYDQEINNSQSFAE